MQNGTIKFFDHTKGFGFITGADDNKDYFFHHTAIEDSARVRDGDSVTFEGSQGPKGPRADNVKLVSNDSAASGPAVARSDENSADVQLE